MARIILAFTLFLTSTCLGLRFLNNIGGVNLSHVVPTIEDGQVQLLTTYYGRCCNSGMYFVFHPLKVLLIRLPIIETTTNEWCNGGLPQLANISAHLAKAG
jgi:hypothetical protein